MHEALCQFTGWWDMVRLWWMADGDRFVSLTGAAPTGMLRGSSRTYVLIEEASMETNRIVATLPALNERVVVITQG
jgi:hypothetical protein